jgi:hypothetical protein
VTDRDAAAGAGLTPLRLAEIRCQALAELERGGGSVYLLTGRGHPAFRVRELAALLDMLTARPSPAAAPRDGEPNHRLRGVIDRLERLHQRVDGSVDDFCSADDQAWPCDTMVVIAAARETARGEG